MTGEAIDRCHATIAHHSKSFALASLLLPAAARDDAAVLYAWCRRADDAIDLAPSEHQARALHELRVELAAVYANERRLGPELEAFRDVVIRNAIPAEYPSALLDGMHMDVVGTSYRDLDGLLLYCHRVAGTVGLMMCHVLGVSHPTALRHATHLGIAMQLTNICRDVAEDWERGRCYVPSATLGAVPAAGSEANLVALRQPLRLAVAELLARSSVFYRSGDRGLRYLPWRAALAVRAARLIYSAIGWRIALRNYEIVGARVVVPRWAKIVLAVGAALRSLLIDAPRSVVTRFRPARLDIVVRYPQDVLPL